MSPRPVIFVSAVSQELKSARDLVARTLLRLGYEPVWQDLFGTEQGDIRQMLREKIQPCAALIQLLGQRYGCEPPAPDEHFGRISYTQFEQLYAREQGKPVWLLLLGDTFPTDPTAAEPAELTELQRLYRQRIGKEPNVYHGIANPDALEAKVLGLRDDLARLRRGYYQWAALVIALLVVSIGLGAWMVKKQDQIVQIATDPRALKGRLEEKIDETFERKKEELLTAKAPPAEVDALYRWRDRAKGQVAEAVAFITARAADPASPIVTRAAAILQERGVDATLEYLASILTAKGRSRKVEGRQLGEASLMKAGLHASRLETAEQEHALRDAIADAPDWWRPHNDLGLLLHDQAQWAAAEREYEAARQTMPAEAEAIVLNNLGQLYQATNRLAEAEPLMERALKIDETSTGSKHSDVARDLNNLGLLYQATNRLGEAESLMERALNIDEKNFGPEHLAVARDLNNLALLYRDTNRLEQTEPMMQRALKIAEKRFGPEHPNVAAYLNNLAQVYSETSRLGEAEPLMERALKIDEKILGLEHPAVARDLNNLAALYQATSRLAEAEPLMDRALKIDEKSFGPEHPEVARDLNNLAYLYLGTNRLEKAELFLKRALSIVEKSFGPTHPRVASGLNNLAQFYQATNRLAEAEPLMDRALKIDEKSFEPEHPDVAIHLNNLARLYQATSRLAEAEPLMRWHLVILLKFTQKTGHSHPDLNGAIVNYLHLLTERKVPNDEAARRLAEAGREAGFAPEEYAGLLRQLAQDYGRPDSDAKGGN